MTVGVPPFKVLCGAFEVRTRDGSLLKYLHIKFRGSGPWLFRLCAGAVGSRLATCTIWI